ncbi:MAG: DinB family protein [Pelomonas sp.]|nr:DinB family protein [Roseateles sp.]
MSTRTLMMSLFEHKAWIEPQFFDQLAQVDATAHADAHHQALRILNHIHTVDRIWAGHLKGEAHGLSGTNTEHTPTPAELRAAFQALDAWYLDHVRGMTEAQFDEVISFRFTDGDTGRMTRGEMLAHVITHGSNHRGGVGVWLRQGGSAPPRDLLTRHLHVTEPHRREA